ncbi:MAG TPA: hypothetical protein VFT72_09655 [Opitutaceae bacterium]|nr:hypothetical protein [Opitutaceae bacterium]
MTFFRSCPFTALLATALAVFFGDAGAAERKAAAQKAEVTAANAKHETLAQGLRPLLTKKRLHGVHHVMQSFAFNPLNGEIYAVQVEGTNERGTSRQHWENGDLELTRLSADGDEVLGYMFLEGFGHGVSMGVEPEGDTVYLWTEVDSRPIDDGSGRGTKIGRFRFVNGKTLKHDDVDIAKFVVAEDAIYITPSLNMAGGLFMARYASAKRGGRMALFRLADVKAGGTPKPIYDVPMPKRLGTFQGYCMDGERVYLLTGQAYTAANPPPGNAEIFCVDWKTGRVIERGRTDIFGEQVHREPEGMAIRVREDGARELCVGFASSISRSDSRRVISIASVPLEAAPQGSRRDSAAVQR